jgi:hypothetical protein
VSGVKEIPREQAAAAPELDHETVALEHRLEQLQDPRRAIVGVEAEPPVVDQREVLPVVRGVRSVHGTILPSMRTSVDGTG